MIFTRYVMCNSGHCSYDCSQTISDFVVRCAFTCAGNDVVAKNIYVLIVRFITAVLAMCFVA